MKRILLVAALLALAACDTTPDGREYTLTLFDADGERAATLTFDPPRGEACDGLGCGSGPADWRARHVTAALLLDQTRGTLYATEVDFGAYEVSLTPEIADGGVTLSISETPSGDVSGTWANVTFSGTSGGGRVQGRLE